MDEHTSTTAHRTTQTWFVTGASRGFGRVWVEAALERGDMVAATVRSAASVADLVERFPSSFIAIELDVTDRRAVFSAVRQAVERFGRLDVIVANAGFGLFGAVEETGEQAARRQLEVNFFGVLWVLQAIAPTLRAQGSGHVLLTSSFGGLISFPTAGLYGASKFAVEGLGGSFAMEMQDFGVEVTLVEPAAYATDFAGTSAQQADQNPAYDSARERTGVVFAAMPPGDPSHTAEAVVELVAMPNPPRRLMLGAYVLPLVVQEYEDRLDSWRAHHELAELAQ